MRALITGITGQDGYYLSRHLMGRGSEVHGLVQPDDSAGAEQVRRELPAVHQWAVRLTEPSEVAQLLQDTECDVVFHLAALSSVALSWEQPLHVQQVNAVGTGVMLEAVRRHGERTGREVRLVNASSSEIFGEPHQSPQNESTPIDAVSPYGASKAYAHLLVRVYRRQGLHASNCILFNHESPRRPPVFVTRKITQAVARIALGGSEQLTLGNLQARRDWGWAPDYVSAMSAASERDVGDDYVVATGHTRSVEDFLAHAFGYVGLDWHDHVQAEPSLMRPDDVTEQRGDNSHARNTLGWKPTLSFEQIVERMVDADLAEARGE